MLTQRELDTYNFIREYITANGMAPTEAEIALGIGIKSRGVVHRYVTSIASEGLIKIIPNKRRNISLVDDNDDASGGLPIIGKIAAGQPIEALDQHHELNINSAFAGSNRFILEVSGDSMIGDNICDGDYIICEKSEVAGPADIAVVLVDSQEATLKRIKPNSDDTITLMPSNPEFKPATYASDRIQIQGVYLGLLRINHH